jgi:hypothetical protein
MARRDLSRTVIEGGRYRYNKWKRRQSHGTGRAREREWLDEIRVDAGVADERALRERPRVRRQFYDKLAVPTRWLRSRVGHRWDEVFSELMTRFDPRTTAGNHIVYDHMLRDVRGAIEDEVWRTYEFEIDAGGILRALPTWRELRKQPKAPPWTEHRWAAELDGRWWWVGDRLVGPCARVDLCRFHHHYRDGVAHHYTRATRLTLMTSRDIGRVTSLPPRVREVVLWSGPVVEPEHAHLARTAT